MQRLRLKRYILLTFAVIVGLFLLGATILVVDGFNDRFGKADVALVLGNKVENDNTPSLRLRARLDKIVELYQAGYFPIVIASGGIDKEGHDEALVMRDYLSAHGIPKENIIADSGGVNTYASAKNTLQIIQQRKLKSVFVISQYYHIPRAKLALRRFGVSSIYCAHANFFEVRDIYSIPRELIGYISYSFRKYEATMTPNPTPSKQ